MNNLQDLHFKKEIIPLFDFVGNEFSRFELVNLMTELPESLNEILIRQNILKGLIKHEIIYQFPVYSAADFNEVYAYTNNYKTRNLSTTGNALKLHLLFSKIERNQERARLTQLVIFLSKLNQTFFSHLIPDVFPEPFKQKLENINGFLTELEIARCNTIVRKKSLSNADIARLIEFFLDKTQNGKIDAFWKDVFLLEAYFSISKGIIKHKLVFPEFRDDNFSITEFYHPLLKSPIKNNIVCVNNVNLITGPNMSGKSTLLKAIGLCVLLAHLGLGVSAAKCELPFFEQISVAINLNDDLKNGFSHFMTEIHNLKQVIQEASLPKKCFAIFDELFRGTNEEDALAISKTTVTGLSRFKNSIFFISTHLQQLKDVCIENTDKISTYYTECNFNNNKPVFTYKLQPGWSDLRIGQILFEEEGLSELLAQK